MLKQTPPDYHDSQLPCPAVPCPSPLTGWPADLLTVVLAKHLPGSSMDQQQGEVHTLSPSSHAGNKYISSDSHALFSHCHTAAHTLDQWGHARARARARHLRLHHTPVMTIIIHGQIITTHNKMHNSLNSELLTIKWHYFACSNRGQHNNWLEELRFLLLKEYISIPH